MSVPLVAVVVLVQTWVILRPTLNTVSVVFFVRPDVSMNVQETNGEPVALEYEQLLAMLP